jgi:hypothetical protein
VLGLVLVAVFALKTELLREKPLLSIGVSGFLVATAPFVFLYCLGLCCHGKGAFRSPIMFGGPRAPQNLKGEFQICAQIENQFSFK